MSNLKTSSICDKLRSAVPNPQHFISLSVQNFGQHAPPCFANDRSSSCKNCIRTFVLLSISLACANSTAFGQSLSTRSLCHARPPPFESPFSTASEVLAPDIHDWISDLLMAPEAASLDLSLANVAFPGSLKQIKGRENVESVP